MAALILLAAGSAAAEDGAMPTRGGHTFVPAPSIVEPFIVSYVQTSVALGGATNTTTPFITLPDSTTFPIGTSDQAFTALSFTYQHRMKDWLAVQVAVEAAGRLGTSTRTLISDGITASVGYDIGWRIRCVETESTILSGAVHLTNKTSTFINVLRWFEDLITGPDASLVRSKNALRGTGGLQGAWGISKRFGLLGSFTMEYGESFTGEGGNEWLSDGRIGLSYDLRQDLRVPLGLALVGGHTGVYQLDNSEAWFWSARLALQTREDFSIGFDVSQTYFDSQVHGGEMQFTQLAIDTRYFY